MNKIQVAAIIFAMGMVLWGAEAMAQRGAGRGQPPTEAYQACDGKADNDQCTFTRRDGKNMEGLCRPDRDAPDMMVCVPDRPSAGRDKRGRSGPPPEAYNACDGKADNDQCTFTRRDGKNMEGLCRPDRYDPDMMVCVPDGPSPGRDKRGRGGPPPEAYNACDGKANDDQCTFARRDGKNVEGLCRPDRDAPEVMVCVSERPLPRPKSR